MKYIVDKQEKLTKSIIHSIVGVSFSDAQKYLRLGRVKVDGVRTKKDVAVSIGQEVEVFVMELKKPKVDILYEDDNVIVVFKPNGMEVSILDKTDDKDITLQEHLEGKETFVVHRLDRLTEGVVILAKNMDAKVALDHAFKAHTLEKCYQALVYGSLPKTHDIMKDYLVKDSDNSVVKVYKDSVPNSKEIITEYDVLEVGEHFTKVKVTLHTGRTHQIRAHFSFIGNPVVNDSKYELKKFKDIVAPSKYRGYYLTSTSLTLHFKDGILQYLDGKTFEVNPSWTK
ncbi:MAG: RluA family pseudouridine synthase [Clostridia bacterium]|nr:RluA family pseudouridine synthase [Clostridia bacterium]